MPNEVDYDRACRCVVAISSPNGLEVFSNLLSNLFDIHHDAVYQTLYNLSKDYEKHRKLGGRIKDFENGKVLK